MNILEAIENPKLFRRYLAPDGDLSSWSNWLVMLRALYGLPCDSEPHDDANNDEHGADFDAPSISSPVEFAELIRLNTGRDVDKLPTKGFDEALLLCGRRSGKSKIVALCAAFEAVLGEGRSRLSPGELGMVAIISPTRSQSRVCHEYVRSCLTSTPVLAREVEREERDKFVLKSGIEIVILTGDPRVVRGFSLIACIVDEICFFGLDAESKVRSDTELIRSVRPSLATTRGRLLCISTPFRPQGYAYETHARNYGNDDGAVLIWTAPSVEMNPTLSPRVVERALAEDEVSARCEYVVSRGCWRTDVDDFISREVIERLVVKGRQQLEPKAGTQYRAFADLSGGMVDDAALAIGHMENRKVVIDVVERWPAPHRPQTVVREMVDILRRYSLSKVVGDWFSAQWVRTEFETHNIKYDRAEKSVWNSGTNAWHKVRVDKSQLFLELLPWLHSGGVELLDNRRLVSQLSSLQRFARQVGKDRVDHAPGAHDDLANSVAGVVYSCSQRSIDAGAVTPRGVGAVALTIDDREDLLNRESAEGQKHYDDPDLSTLHIGPQLPLF